MAKTTWADVEKGQRVELGGKVFVVTKIKAKGKRAKVAVVGAGGRFESEVKLKDAVTLAPKAAKKPEREKWHKPTKAEKAEQDAVLGGFERGDLSATKAGRLSSKPWSEPRSGAEQDLTASGAKLIAETDDESRGYYVPPVDGSTVAAHWMIFHHGDEWEQLGEAELLRRHERQHLPGDDLPLKVNHWHVATRPKIKKAGKR